MGKRIDREGITPEWLRWALNYCPATGVLTWRMRPVSAFPCLREANRWNNRYGDTKALAHVKRGYLVGCISGFHFSAHRVCWAVYYGEWPSGQIDHINGNRADNRIENLRVVTCTENNRNRKIPKTNTSGIMGVARDPEQKSMWRVSISTRGRSIVIGRYACLGKAMRRRKRAEAEIGYHQNHGRVA